MSTRTGHYLREFLGELGGLREDEVVAVAHAAHEVLVTNYLRGRTLSQVLRLVGAGARGRILQGLGQLWPRVEGRLELRHLVVPSPAQVLGTSGVGSATGELLYTALHDNDLADVRWCDWAARRSPWNSKLTEVARTSARQAVEESPFAAKGGTWHLQSASLFWVLAHEAGVIA